MGVRAKAHTVKPQNPAFGQAAPEVEGEEASMSVAERERLAGKQTKLASQEEGLRQARAPTQPSFWHTLASLPLPSSANAPRVPRKVSKKWPGGASKNLT